MVNILTVDAATANVTNTTFAHKIGLTDGPFGLEELESVLSFPARNGRSWTVSIRTSDSAAVVFIILVLTFAIDHFLFKSRYLMHIGGATRDNDHSATLNEKASLHEKEALSLESGQKCSNDEDIDQKLKPEHDSASRTSTIFPRWVHRAFVISLMVFLLPIFDGKNAKETASQPHKETLESWTAKAKATAEVDKLSRTSWRGKFLHNHPWSQRTLNSAILLLELLFVLAVFAFHLLFWPLILTLFVLLQVALYTELDNTTTVPWQSIAFKSSFHLAIWTILGVTFLLKPNRLQGVLWKCFRWTHAINWWLFWAVIESHLYGPSVARLVGFQYTGITAEVILFILRPSLVAYLYSGVVRDGVIAVRLCKHLWNTSITKL